VPERVGHRRGRGVHDEHDALPVPFEALVEIVDRGLGRQRPGREPPGRGPQRRDPVDPEDPPVVLVEVPAEQVPAQVAVDLPVRLDAAESDRAVPPLVLEGDDPPVPNGVRQCPQISGVRARHRDRAGLQTRSQARGPGTQPFRQVLLDLSVSPGGGLLHAALGSAAGGREHGEPEQGRDRLVVAEHERRQHGPRREPVVAARSGPGLHRVAVAADPVDVAPQRARADTEPGGQLPAGERTPGLERRQQREGALGDVRHDSSLSRIAAGKRPHPLVASDS